MPISPCLVLSMLSIELLNNKIHIEITTLQINAKTTKAVGPKDDKHKFVRKFLDTLITTFKADINGQVQKKTLVDTVPTTEKEWYTYPSEGIVPCWFICQKNSDAQTQ